MISPISSFHPVTPMRFDPANFADIKLPIQTQSNQHGTHNAPFAFMPRHTINRATAPVSTPAANSISTAPPTPAATDAEVREKYNQDVSKAYAAWLVGTAAIHMQDQCITEPLAREAFDTRTSIKEAAQATTSVIGRAAIWLRNMVSYGASNATFEGLSKKKNPEEIAYSAFKTGGGDLGLKDNGFTDSYNTWMAVKHIAPHIYPENINAGMIETFKAQGPGKTDPLAILAAGQSIAPWHDIVTMKA